MELKSKLIKPYLENERMDFIVKQNHELGYEIRETESELQSWGYTNEEIQQHEIERISHLKCTKRVLVLMLEELGKDYFNDILPLIDANRQAKLEWELCVELERSNPLLDIIGQQLGISHEQIDVLFKYANGEVDSMEVSNE